MVRKMLSGVVFVFVVVVVVVTVGVPTAVGARFRVERKLGDTHLQTQQAEHLI